MKKTIIKCYFCTVEEERTSYLCEYDKRKQRNGLTKKYKRFVLKDNKGYLLSANLACYKLDGKGLPIIIDIQTGMSIGSAQLTVWGKVCKTFKDIEQQDIESLDKWLNENIRNKDYYNKIKEKFNKLLMGEVNEILEVME